MDFITRLPKYAHFVPLKHPYTAKTLADAFVKEVIWCVPVLFVIFVSNF